MVQPNLGGGGEITRDSINFSIKQPQYHIALRLTPGVALHKSV